MNKLDEAPLWKIVLTDRRFWVLGIAAILVVILIWAAINFGAGQLRTPDFNTLDPANNVIDADGSSFGGSDASQYDAVDPELPRSDDPGYRVVSPPELVEASPQLTALTPGETVYAQLDAGIFRQWDFEGMAGERLDLLLMPHGDPPHNLNLTAEIFAPDGSVLTKLDSGGVGELELARGLLLPATGAYSIWVSDDDFNDAGAYAMLALTDQAKNGYPLRIGVGQKLVSELERGSWHSWILSANAGDVVTIRATPFLTFDSDFDLELSVVDPLGQLMVEQKSGGVGEEEAIVGLTLPIAGNYVLWLSDAGFDNAGSYLLEAAP